MELEDTGDTGFDIGAAMDAIASPADTSAPKEETQEELFTDDKPAADTKPVESKPADPSAPVVRAPPKSWAKEKHELWSKLPADAQEYYEVREKQFLDGLEQYKGDAGLAKQFKDIVTPYTPMLAAMGVTQTDAVKYLLNAQYQLTSGSPEQRKAAYEKIGADLGLIQAQEQAPIDPAVKQLQDRIKGLESTLTQRQQAELREAQAKASTEVETFASDPARAYFNEVSTDMVPLINAGFSLADAYERAVWANPITRAKEQARLQTEAAAALKETAKVEGEAARRATGANVRGSESRKAPTEPQGKMYDDMADILTNIKRRTN